jgi:hypothetical protein
MIESEMDEETLGRSDVIIDSELAAASGSDTLLAVLVNSSAVKPLVSCLISKRDTPRCIDASVTNTRLGFSLDVTASNNRGKAAAFKPLSICSLTCEEFQA